MLNFIFHFAITCQPKQDFFGLPTWYKYLDGQKDLADPSKCIPTVSSLSNASQLWGIGLGILDILLRIAGIVAIGYVIFGGIQYITSQGNPDSTAKAKDTITNALIGLIIAILGSTVVLYLGSRL